MYKLFTKTWLIVADGAADITFTKHSKTETDEGTALVKEFLDTWKARVEAHGGAVDGDAEMELSEDAQIDELRRVAEEYKERFEGNTWVKSLMESY